jgi:hypothetical protein
MLYYIYRNEERTKPMKHFKQTNINYENANDSMQFEKDMIELAKKNGAFILELTKAKVITIYSAEGSKSVGQKRGIGWYDLGSSSNTTELGDKKAAIKYLKESVK